MTNISRDGLWIDAFAERFPDLKHHFTRAFDQIDGDGDGFISDPEFSTAVMNSPDRRFLEDEYYGRSTALEQPIASLDSILSDARIARCQREIRSQDAKKETLNNCEEPLIEKFVTSILFYCYGQFGSPTDLVLGPQPVRQSQAPSRRQTPRRLTTEACERLYQSCLDEPRQSHIDDEWYDLQCESRKSHCESGNSTQFTY